MRKRSKIIIFSEGPYSGILRSMVEDSKLFKQKGMDIVFLLPDKARDRYGESRNINIEELDKYGIIECTPLRRKYRYLFSDLLKVKKYFQNTSYDIIISYGGYAGKLSRLLYKFGVIQNLIHVPQGFDTIHKKWIIRYPDEFFEKILAQDCSLYLACGSSEVYKMKNTYKISGEKIYLNPNSVSVNSGIIQKDGCPRYKYLILSRIAEDKRVEKSLEALQLLDLTKKTLVIGDGRDLTILKENYPNATYLGNIQNDKIFQYIISTMYVISCSVVEGMPFSVLEAMSVGNIPILSCSDGHKDIIQNGVNGFIFNNDAELLDTLLYTEIIAQEDYERISVSARETVRNLDIYKKSCMDNIIKDNFRL